MAIRYENFRNVQDDDASTPVGFFDAQISGIPNSITENVFDPTTRLPNTIVTTPQVLVEGFGSYLADILPPDIAASAGAFGASMQQIKNITQIPVEKFAQVVASIETTQGLGLVNGTNVPTDVSEAQIAYELIAFGSGPYKTYTYSDFYGCMSGLPYPWQELQTLLEELQTANLVTIYQNLYNIIVAGPASPDPGDIAIYNQDVQDQIDLANDAIDTIRTVRPGASVDLNDLYNNFGTQLGNEQRARNINLSALPDPRDPAINKYPIIEYAFVDNIPTYGKQTQPNMAAQTIEAIANLDIVSGQSIVALMRQSRNQDRLNLIGVPQDNNIIDFVAQQKEWIGDGAVGNSAPAYPNNTEPLGYYDPTTDTYNVSNNPVDTGGPKVPGSLAKSPYQNLIPPQLNTLFTSDVLLPAQYNVPDAIEQVITCNCDCWL